MPLSVTVPPSMVTWSSVSAAGEVHQDGTGIGEAGAGHGDVVERQRLAALAVHRSLVEARAAVDCAIAGDVDQAVRDAAEIVDGAARDGGLVQRQRAGAVNGDGAAAIGDRGQLVESERAAGHNLKRVVVGHGLVMQRIANAADIDLTGIAKLAVLQRVSA